MFLPHRGLKLCPYSKALLQGLSIDPKSKAPDKHSQLKIFSLSYRYIYIKNWYRTPKIVPPRFSYYNVPGKIWPRLRVIPGLAYRATRFRESLHLSCKRDQIKMKYYMDRQVTSPTCCLPPPCKQALKVNNTMLTDKFPFQNRLSLL